MKLYDTLSNKKKELIIPKNKTLRLFVCGPTVYDDSHVGHARTYITFDILVKYLRHIGYKVFYLQNITDIAEEIIKKAQEQNRSEKEIAQKIEKEYLQDMKALKITSVDKYARASDYIQEIISQIKILIDKNYAYQTSTGVYFRVKNFKNYGKLSRQNIKKLHQAVNIEEDDEKEEYIDFALWKIAKEGENSWPSPWGEGRPGWHIEDTAITKKEFKGPKYELHGGARDLIFPHHEAEIAQMEAAYGKPPLVKFWIHTGYLQIKREKMSKSLKNFISIRDVLKKYSPQTLRIFFTTKHYRSPINYTEKGLQEAETNEKKLREFWINIENFRTDATKKEDKKILNYIKNFWKYLEDDFNTPRSFGELFSLITYTNKKDSLNKKDKKIILDFLKNINKIFNVIDYKKIKASNKIPPKVAELINKRELLREEKKWNEADVLRKKIEKIGYVIEDSKNISRIKKK